MRPNLYLFTIAAALAAMPAEAYVGPGLGLGAIGVLVGLVMTLFMALFAFVWMPLKRMFTRRAAGAPDMTADDV
ncbi:MAG: hypothetical protein K8F59_09580 [Rhodobacteraceae bacterium]|nr:hypothetical protein [Paracoccaceae bacterium]